MKISPFLRPTFALPDCLILWGGSIRRHHPRARVKVRIRLPGHERFGVVARNADEPRV